MIASKTQNKKNIFEKKKKHQQKNNGTNKRGQSHVQKPKPKTKKKTQRPSDTHNEQTHWSPRHIIRPSRRSRSRGQRTSLWRDPQELRTLYIDGGDKQNTAYHGPQRDQRLIVENFLRRKRWALIKRVSWSNCPTVALTLSLRTGYYCRFRLDSRRVGFGLLAVLKAMRWSVS